MKNIKDLGEKVAIQCKTQNEWDYINKNLGYNLFADRWEEFEYNSCINANKKNFDCVEWYKSQGYTIHQASDFMPLSPQDEIKELKARIATLEEPLIPKKKIEFVKYLSNKTMELSDRFNPPSTFDIIELLYTDEEHEYDIIKAYHKRTGLYCIYLGHFNDGIK